MLPYEVILSNQTQSTPNQVFPVAFPHRGFITKLIVKETTGASITPTVDFFNINPASIADASHELNYHVTATQTLVAGGLELYVDDFIPFFNHDPVDRTGGHPDLVYIRINGSGTGTFAFTVGGFTDLT